LNLFKYLTLLVFLLANVIPFSAQALQPPTKEQLANYKKQGSLQEKILKAKAYGNFKVSGKLTNTAEQYLTRTLDIKNQQKNSSAPESITPWKTGFASTGTQKTFTLLLAFSDSPAPEHQSAEVIYNHIYGDGLSERFPRESLTNFYKRSSYDQLTITGEVLPWYTTTYPRDEVSSERDIIKDALRFHEEQGVDFSQYDNDGDGVIDYFSVIWTGEIGEWASQWWGHQSSIYDTDFILSGKTLSTYSWQALSYDNEVDDFNPTTLIHETGHALGLPDYYDYDREIGPDLEFPIADMMRNNSGDHNAFSKFLLGWIEPKVVGSGSQNITLQASSISQDALIIMPELTLDKGLSEYFVVQHRDQQDNDKDMYDTGLLIWHVDATLEYSDFKFDNSYSEHPLIKLVYDKNYTDITELYFQAEDELTSLTTPSSTSYVERNASVEIKTIQKSDSLISMAASIVSIPTITLSGLKHLEALADNNTLIANIDSVDAITKVALYVNGELINEDFEAPYQFNLLSTGVLPGNVNIVVEAYTATAKGITSLQGLKLPDETALIVVNLTNDDTLAQTLDYFLKPVLRMSDIAIVTPDDIPAIFVVAHNHNSLTDEQFSRLINYVNLGGHLYYENTDWYFDRSAINTQWRDFGIQATTRWSQAPATISGLQGSIVEGLSYSTPEGYFLVNELESYWNNGKTNNLWQTSDRNFSNTISNEIASSKIIATTGKYSWFPHSLALPVMSKYLDFFGLDSAVKPVSITMESRADEHYLEGEHTLEFVVARSYDNGTDSSANFTIESDNAVEGIDYAALASNTIVFTAGELSKTIELTLLDDLKVDGDKELYITLSGDDVISEELYDTRAYIYIEDNEHRGALQFKVSSMSIAENSGTYSVTVTRIGGVDEQIEFTLSSKDGTAMAGTDYQEVNKTLVFEQYDVEKTFELSVIDNNSYAVDKSFSLEISSDYLTGVQSSMTITINNDEAAPKPVTPVAEKSSSGGASYLLLYLLLLISGCRYKSATVIKV